jgi:hypothetical protein
MSETVLNDMLTPEEAVNGNVRCLCFVLDEDIIEGLQRIEKVFGIPIGAIITEYSRPFINTFMPIADLYEQGKVTMDCIPEAMKYFESLVTRIDIGKARLDREVKKLNRQQKMKGGIGDEGKSTSST